MKPETLDHLQIAERNRELARALLDPSNASLRPSPWEWVAVVAFYAAVHYVNAYLWETQGVDPGGHGRRGKEVQRNPRLAACFGSYQRLTGLAWSARYSRGFVLPEQDARDLVDVDYRLVETTVLTALGLPVPQW